MGPLGLAGLPSGKHTKNYGKSPFSMGKSTISMAMFNSYVTNYQRLRLVAHPTYYTYMDNQMVPGISMGIQMYIHICMYMYIYLLNIIYIYILIIYIIKLHGYDPKLKMANLLHHLA